MEEIVMSKMIGRVIEVFIPDEYNKNNELIDVMDCNKIGFKVMLDNSNEIIICIFEQDEIVADIYREDKVLLIKDDLTNETINIELYDGESYD